MQRSSPLISKRGLLQTGHISESILAPDLNASDILLM
jgi:hypothetical protein